MPRPSRLLLVALLLPLLVACGGSQPEPAPTAAPAATFRIVSGSENETLEPIVQRFAEQTGVAIEVDYLGSVDIMLALERGAVGYDAVWPANSLWIALGDTRRLVRDEQSIMRSPVVMGVKKPVAEKLGWVGREVRVADILAAAEAGDLRFMMTSATQSNSGASAYMGYLYAFAGGPEVLTKADLADPALRDNIRRILGTIERSSGSSGWLKDLFIQRYDDFDAMVNYESLVIEANRELVDAGRDPLYAVYPVDGLALADSPLGYVNHGDPAKEALFGELQAYLLAPQAQAEILAAGRRVGPLGVAPEGVDRAVFNPDWGIDLDRVIAPIRFPDAAVTREALDLYQTVFRKPSFTVFCLDYSGSMEGPGEAALQEAMATLLNQDEAATVLLQAAPDDVTVVIPFSDAPIAEWTVLGNDPAELRALLAEIEAQPVGGNTNIWDPVARAYEVMTELDVGDRFPAVILMTDGQGNRGDFSAIEKVAGPYNLETVPVYGILFGDASREQVDQIAAASSGRVFDGSANLVDAFRSAKGYN